MLIEGEPISEHITCPICNNIFENARFIPCNRTVCFKCIQSSISNNTFKCILCKKKEHEIPVNGFPASTLVMQLVVKYNKYTQSQLSSNEAVVPKSPEFPSPSTSQVDKPGPGPKSYKIKSFFFSLIPFLKK